MGYRCPVCGDPQADDGHLANHLAFTAIARGGDHEDWLDEHVPDWAERDEEGLAAQVTDLAASAEYPQVFEDTTEPAETGRQDHTGPAAGSGSHEHADGPGEDHDPDHISPEFMEHDFGGHTEETRAIIEEARELTRKRRGVVEESVEESDQESVEESDQESVKESDE